MAEGYWNRQQTLHPSPSLLKRPRTEYEAPGLPSGHEMHNYVARDDDRAGPRILKDSKTLESAYDRYLQSVDTLWMNSIQTPITCGCSFLDFQVLDQDQDLIVRGEMITRGTLI